MQKRLTSKTVAYLGRTFTGWTAPALRLAHLLDHLVGARQQCGWNLDAERFGRLQIDDELKFGRELDRHFGWIFTLKNTSCKDPGLPELIAEARSIAHQAAGVGKFTSVI